MLIVENKANRSLDTFYESDTVSHVMRQNKPEIANVRLTPDDQKIIGLLMKKLGITTVSQVVRQALRAFATKEGIAA